MMMQLKLSLQLERLIRNYLLYERKERKAEAEVMMAERRRNVNPEVAVVILTSGSGERRRRSTRKPELMLM